MKDDMKKLTKEVRKSGTSGCIYLPKELIGKKVTILISAKDLQEMAIQQMSETGVAKEVEAVPVAEKPKIETERTEEASE